MSSIQIKKGTAPFKFSGVFSLNGSPVDLTGWQIRCQLRKSGTGELVEELQPSIGPAVGAFQFQSAGSTAAWPLGKIVYDIEFKDQNNAVFYSEDGYIELIKSQTQPA